MVYRLDVDPQDTVVPETLHLTVTWPDGFRPTRTLPAGWRATRHGATFDGPITEMQAWRIPLTRS
jgi:hypothetical protein